MRNWPRVVMLAAAAWTGAAAAREFRALVYRGPAVCQNCPGALAQLLESSPQKVAVTYAGPGEEVKVTAESLRNVDVFAYGGGPGTLSFSFFPESTSFQASVFFLLLFVFVWSWSCRFECP